MSDAKKRSADSFVEDTASAPVQHEIFKLPEPGSHERALAERRLVRKLDLRVLPTIFLIFIMNYIDVRVLTLFLQLCHLILSPKRNGITTARLKGMQQDLNINGKTLHTLFEYVDW